MNNITLIDFKNGITRTEEQTSEVAALVRRLRELGVTRVVITATE